MSIQNQKKFIFDLLGSEIFGGEIEKEPTTAESLPALYQLSKSHDLAHLVADALDKNGSLDDSEICNKFRAERNLAIYRYEQINYAFEEICGIFEAEKIENIPLKGAILREYYPQPWMRTSCDIDILVRRDQIKNIVRILTEKYGYKYVIHTQHDYSLYSSGGVHIELHFILVFHEKSGEDFTKRVWETAIDEAGYAYRKKLPSDLFFAYHIAHMAQHILEGGGCGVKPFLDIQIMKEKMGISLTQAKDALSLFGLTTFAQKAVALSERWFGEGNVGEELREFEEYILCGGVYGTLENKIGVGTTRKKGKVRYVLKRLFLPYRSLCLLYPSLKKCPILFPFYQVRRWFRLFKKGGVKISGAVRELKSVSEMDEGKSEKMKAMLQGLGLK